MAAGWPRKIAGSAFSSVASAAYWTGALGLLEAATLFDYSSGAEPNETWIATKIAGVIAAAPLTYALLLRTFVPVRGARRWFGLVAFSVLAGLYWLVVNFVLYGLTAGDRREGPMEPSTADRIGVLLFALSAIAIFALLLHSLRTVLDKQMKGTPPDA